MGFWHKDPGHGCEEVVSTSEMIRAAIGEKRQSVIDCSPEPLEPWELDALIKAGLTKRPWTVLLCFHHKQVVLKYGKKIEPKQPVEKADMGLNGWHWFLPGGQKLKHLTETVIFVDHGFRLFKKSKKLMTPSEQERDRVRQAEREEHQRLLNIEYEKERAAEKARKAEAARKFKEEAFSNRPHTVKGNTSLGAGAFGSYIKLSDEYGVKVLRDYMSHSCETLDVGNEKIAKEFKAQRRAHELCGSLVPAVIAIIPVQMDGYWYPGILMEHVEGLPLAKWASEVAPHDVTKYNNLCRDGLRLTYSYMNEAGVTKTDHHEYNVLVDKQGHYRVIDFGFGCHTYGRDADQQSTLKKAG